MSRQIDPIAAPQPTDANDPRERVFATRQACSPSAPADGAKETVMANAALRTRPMMLGLLALLASACGTTQGNAAGGNDTIDAAPAQPASASSVAMAANSSPALSSAIPSIAAKGTPLVVPTASHPALVRALSVAHLDPQVEQLMVPNRGALTLTEDAKSFASLGWRSQTRADVSRMGAVLPPYADGEWRIGPGRTEKWSLRMTGRGMHTVAGALDAGRLVYEEAWAHTDVLVNTGERGMEWMLTLKDASAPTSFAWRVKLGSELTVRTGHYPDGSIELLDAAGDAALLFKPAFGIDAKGQKRAAKLAFVGDELRLSMDTAGLTYPILIDPLALVPTWQLIDSGSLTDAAQYGFMVRFGASGALGFGGGWVIVPPLTIYNNTYTFGGTSWAAGPAFPITAFGFGATYAANGKPYVYGGSTASDSSAGSTALYVGDPSTYKWTPICASGSCGSSFDWINPGLAAVGNQLIHFGGANNPGYGSSNLTLLMDLTSGSTSFTDVTAGLATYPRSRYGHVLVGGPNASVAMLFGGSSSSIVPYYSDTWLWTPSGALSGSWQCICDCVGTAVPCPNQPPPTLYGAATYDENRGHFVMYGGLPLLGDGKYDYGTAATYDFDPVAKTWTALCLDTGPDVCSINGRTAPAIAFDSARRRVIAAGGNFTSTWALSIRGGDCTTGAQCDTSYCVNNSCCTTSSCPTCQSCALTGTEGTCTNIPALSPDTLKGCAACDGAGNCKKALGLSCSLPSECASGNCVNSTCCATSSCGVGLTCADSAGTCKTLAGGACLTGTTCATGYCVDGVCCGTASCPAGQHCSYPGAGGNCLADNGQSCTTGANCGTGNCVDGYCCNTACGNQCQACNVVGSIGTCTNVVGAPHGSRTACGGSGACGAACNGSDGTACHYPGASTACGSASCTSGTATLVGGCNGSGVCTQATAPCGNYTCGTTGCKTSCTADTDCASASFYCTGSACQLKLANGSTCAIGNACQSGNCVGGTCCDSPCTSAGSVCNLPTAPGHCTKANATPCGSSAECGSGNCVDGVCCDTACTGECQACDVGGSVGKCTAVKGPPHGTRAACGGTGAGTSCGATCDGVTTSRCTYPTASTTCGAATCTDGSSLSTYTQIGSCNGSGSCTAGSGDCGTYKCTGTTCGAGCTAKSQCSAGNYCDTVHKVCVPIVGLGNSCTDPTACPSGFCVDGVCCEAACGAGYSCNATPTTKGHCRKLNGVACAVGAECASGYCVDGYCCAGGCTGSCEACNVSGKEGTCTPIVGQPITGHTACSATPTDPTCGLGCNGTDNVACHYATTSTACGTASCTTGTEYDVSTCNGSGACTLATRSCSAYQCGSSSCLTTCGTDKDCATGYFCKTGSCVAAQPLGESCTETRQCQSGSCATGATGSVCCTVPDCGAGAACAGPGSSAGTCLKNNASACGAGAECASGHCVDGVCCDLACNGQCEACDVKGSEGVCTPVTGDPHKGRTACDSLAATDCGHAVCDGSTRTACAGYANVATTTCGADACTPDKKLQQHGHCDGKGACQKPDPVSCVEYACDTTANACKSSCTADTDCADTYKCDAASRKCIQGASCSADKTKSIDKSGAAHDCTPYMCGTDGTCLKQCATSEDCVTGSSCNTTIAACVVTATTTTSSGGCGVGATGSTSGSGAGLAASALALALLRVRRRQQSTKR